jgi:hypothetical protein
MSKTVCRMGSESKMARTLYFTQVCANAFRVFNGSVSVSRNGRHNDLASRIFSYANQDFLLALDLVL